MFPIVLIIDSTYNTNKYIEQIINGGGDNNCSFRAVSALLGKRENNHQFF